MTKQIRPNRRNFLAIGGLAVLSTGGAVAGSRRRRTGGGCCGAGGQRRQVQEAQDGTLEEVQVGPDALLTLDDYRVLGRYRETLRRVSLCRRSRR